jgi:hypothetical protein
VTPAKAPGGLLEQAVGPVELGPEARADVGDGRVDLGHARRVALVGHGARAEQHDRRVAPQHAVGELAVLEHEVLARGAPICQSP